MANITDPERTDPWTSTAPEPKASSTAVAVIAIAVLLGAIGIAAIVCGVRTGGAGWLIGAGTVAVAAASVGLTIGLRRR